MRKILLGVTGSIAAYKACELVRMWVGAGDSVSVVMTKAAKEFVIEKKNNCVQAQKVLELIEGKFNGNIITKEEKYNI